MNAPNEMVFTPGRTYYVNIKGPVFDVGCYVTVLLTKECQNFLTKLIGPMVYSDIVYHDGRKLSEADKGFVANYDPIKHGDRGYLVSAYDTIVELSIPPAK